MNRRTLLTTLASLPLLGWVKPEQTIGRIESPMQVDTSRFEDGFERVNLTIRRFPCRMYLTPELLKDYEASSPLAEADFQRAMRESFDLTELE